MPQRFGTEAWGPLWAGGHRLGQLTALPTAVARGDGELPHPPVSMAMHNSWLREEGAALAGAVLLRESPGWGWGWFLLHQPRPT